MFNKNAVPAFIHVALTAFLAAQPKLDSLPQVWTDDERHTFWFIDQGSKILRMEWFLNLECGPKQEFCDSTKLFASPKNLTSYGFVMDTSEIKGKLNPDNLPIGFSSGTYDDGQYAGLTCAACHTANIRYGKQSLIIEGGPSMLDFEKFLRELAAAVDDTLSDKAKGQRFESRVQRREDLRKDFQAAADSLGQRKFINTPVDPPGFGRVDAFGNIFNQITVEHLKNDKRFAHPPNAPASYPMLWGIAQHPFVQWNYSAPNLGTGQKALGSLARNIGEVIGVFGTVKISHRDRIWFYESSANIENLIKIEGMLARLRAPKWPFESKAAKEVVNLGKKTYKDKCERYHALINPDNPPAS